MRRISHILDLIPLILLFLLPLVRISPEDFSATRRTWIWLALFGIGIIATYLLNYKRVQIKNSYFILAICILAAGSIIALYPPHLIAYVFACIALGCLYTIYARLTPQMTSLFLATMLCMIALYAQWGIIQFVLQQDLHMQFIGESVLNINTPGVASFYINQEKFIRSYGPFSHANSFSGVLLLGCILLIALSISKKLPNYFLFAISSIFALALVTTFSRAALASGICIAIYAAYKKKNIVLLYVILPLIIFTPLVLGRSTDVHDVAAHDRIEGLHWALNMQTASSLIRGYGIGNYQTALTGYLARNNIQHNPWDIAPIHSAPLYMLAEFGIIFFSIITFTLFYLIKKNHLWILLFLTPSLLLDHYFVSQIGPLVWLLSCGIILSHVYYKSEQANNIVY
ncbi:MAG TPA: hypothetical protein VLG69_05265 [Candidatus Andersenbacteria bacterium]|nr:hypothetical protein [Candidatus Andersenbacteria bacterium]